MLSMFKKFKSFIELKYFFSRKNNTESIEIATHEAFSKRGLKPELTITTSRNITNENLHSLEFDNNLTIFDPSFHARETTKIDTSPSTVFKKHVR